MCRRQQPELLAVSTRVRTVRAVVDNIADAQKCSGFSQTYNLSSLFEVYTLLYQLSDQQFLINALRASAGELPDPASAYKIWRYPLGCTHL